MPDRLVNQFPLPPAGRGPGRGGRTCSALPRPHPAPHTGAGTSPRGLSRTVVLATLLLALARPAAAHPILTALESVFVDRDEVTISMRVYAEDLTVFQDLRPDDLEVISTDQVKPAAKKHADFLLDRLRLIDAAGERLEGKTVKIDDSKLTEPGYKKEQLLGIELVYTFSYALDQPPEFLTFAQDIVAPESGFVSEVQLVVRQAGSVVEYQHALTAGEPFTLPFDWSRQPDSAENGDEREAWFARQREKTLGIVDPNAAYARYYVTNRGLKLEFLIPFVGLESLLGEFVDREKRGFLEVDEQPAAREQISEFLRDHNTVWIDGLEVAPTIDRIDFFDVSVRDFGRPAEGTRISTVNSRVGIALFYPAKQPPAKIEIEWTAFSRRVLEIDTLFFGPDGVHEPVFSKYERADFFEWTSPGWPEIPPIRAADASAYVHPKLAVPVVSLTCVVLGLAAALFWLARGAKSFAAGAAAAAAALGAAGWFLLPPSTNVVVDHPFESPPPIPADDVFRTLLANTYRAFDYTEEENVYDALAQSIDGPLLRETYLRVNDGLRMRDQGGAIAVVDEVRVLDGDRESLPPDDETDAPGFLYRSTWTVEGTVEHWGHLHSRTNRYAGLFTVRSVGGEWKITDLEVLDEERVGTSTNVRSIEPPAP